LQRYIFYLLAIKTNNECVLLFEEPEAHSFPKYVRDFSQMIINDRTNQFFITTHSPYVLNTIVENAKPEDVAVFKVDYQRSKTLVNPISEKELSKALNFGNDIIFNL
jgi:AAA15 family ATPase/GTPase